MKLDTLSTPYRIAGAAAALLILSLFLPWYGTSIEGVAADASFTAWQAFSLIDILLLLLGGATLFAVAVAADRSRDLAVPPATTVTVLGAVATLLVLFRFLSQPLEEVNPRYGLFLALLGSAAIAVAGWLAMRDSGESFAAAREDLGDRVEGARRQTASAISGDAARYSEMTREELYEEAQRRDVEGRSEMSKEELIEALRRS